MDTLRRDGEKPRVWGSNYWRERMDAVVLFVDGDADDIYVAEVEKFVNDPVDVNDEADDEFSCVVCSECYRNP